MVPDQKEALGRKTDSSTARKDEFSEKKSAFEVVDIPHGTTHDYYTDSNRVSQTLECNRVWNHPFEIDPMNEFEYPHFFP